MALLQLEPSAGRCAPNAALLTRPLQLRSFPPHGNHALLFKASKSAECTVGCNKHSHLTSPFGSAFNKPPYGLGFVVFSHERWLSDKRAQSCLSHAEDLQAPAQLSSPAPKKKGKAPGCHWSEPTLRRCPASFLGKAILQRYIESQRSALAPLLAITPKPGIS